jgi:hypothetical protein
MNQPASPGRYSGASGPRTIQIYARLGVLIAGEFAAGLAQVENALPEAVSNLLNEGLCGFIQVNI